MDAAWCRDVRHMGRFMEFFRSAGCAIYRPITLRGNEFPRRGKMRNQRTRKWQNDSQSGLDITKSCPGEDTYGFTEPSKCSTCDSSALLRPLLIISELPQCSINLCLCHEVELQYRLYHVLRTTSSRVGVGISVRVIALHRPPKSLRNGVPLVVHFPLELINLFHVRLLDDERIMSPFQWGVFSPVAHRCIALQGNLGQRTTVACTRSAD
jgi:hypothetical protein